MLLLSYYFHDADKNGIVKLRSANEKQAFITAPAADSGFF